MKVSVDENAIGTQMELVAPARRDFRPSILSFAPSIMLGLRRFYQQRAHSSRPLDYLQTWVGGGASASPSSQTCPSTSSLSPGEFRTSPSPIPPGAALANHLPNMSITGNTFLLPTVKLPRSVTPDTLHEALQAAAAASPAARNLLQGRGAGVPLVVDLAEVSHHSLSCLELHGFAHPRWRFFGVPSSSPMARPTLFLCPTRN